LFRAKEGKFGSISRKGHGIRVFGMLKAFFYWLSWKGQNNNWGILFQSFNTTRQKNSWKKTRFGKVKFIFHHDSAPGHESVLAMGKLRDLHYELLEQLPRFGSVWLQSLPETQNLPHW
jgi:hypothetical protein